MEYWTYILYSETLNKFYTGQTNNLDTRIERHNLALVKSTKNGIPWKLIHSTKQSSRTEAIKLETKIKKRGAKRFLDDLKT